MLGGEDYSIVNSQFNFEPQPEGQSSVQCLNVPIIDDEVLEATEMFTVELQSINPNVSASASANSAMIVIMDNDSMCNTCRANEPKSFMLYTFYRSWN